MIEAVKLVKSFKKDVVLDNLNFTVKKGSICGLVGSNGAGKSTLLRIISGVYKATNGELLLDGENVYDNPVAKQKIFYVADTPFFYRDYNLLQMVDFYQSIYPNWSDNKFKTLISIFKLPLEKSMFKFSKGMQRQAALILGLSTSPEWLLLDEAFDGLDPIMRQVLRKFIIEEINENQQSVIISSHNLRELEDICDSVIVLHQGKQVLAEEMDELRLDLNKVQVVFAKDSYPDMNELGLRIVDKFNTGVLETYLIAADVDKITEELSRFKPVVLNIIPLTFEEIFLEKLSSFDYDIKNILN